MSFSVKRAFIRECTRKQPKFLISTLPFQGGYLPINCVWKLYNVITISILRCLSLLNDLLSWIFSATKLNTLLSNHPRLKVFILALLWLHAFLFFVWLQFGKVSRQIKELQTRSRIPDSAWRYHKK